MLSTPPRGFIFWKKIKHRCGRSIPDERAAGHVLTRNKKYKNPQLGIFVFFVAGSGIEPESGGYAYHYSFRYSINRFGVWTIPLSFCLRKVRYLPSSLYTFRNNYLLRLGSVLPCSQFASKRRFHRIWQGFHVTFLWMSPLEPPEVPLL